MDTVYRPPETQKSHRAVFVFLVVGLVIGALIGRGWTKAESPSIASSATSTSGFVLGLGQNAPPNIASEDVEFRLFWEEWQLLKDKYYKASEVEDKAMFYGAMKGLAESVGDPYTTFFEPKGAQEFQEALSGKFSGIGAEIGLREGIITVVAPLPDTPADRAGVKAGDLIAKIDGKETTGFSVEQAVSMIRGDKGTKVVLTIVRLNDKKKTEPFDVEITRDEIQVKSVRLKWIDKQDKIAHLEISNFNTDTVDGLNKAIDEMLAKDVKAIILDLRNNPGGFLDTATYMAGEWVGERIVVKERRQGVIVEQLAGTGKNRLNGIPTVVLVNEGSASASEIVSGALQDYKAATIVGKKTFGKGSVQDYTNLRDGSAIKITIAEWLTPQERTINKTGLDPDISIERTPEDYEKSLDPQLDRAVGILNGSATGTADGVPSSTKR
ncbi:S41 family peptidase [Candidatus Uhrbacteria bacterium]|nr:S41 family peptidase [Candidatus Uhrbacteria bacterium]